ncbi:MAG TPA: asparaginase [Solirubrobacterales bacterium]|nr:asparaginase [Solirubrobacterales bacterium]
MATVVCMATGGTIAATFDPDLGGLRATMPASGLFDGIPGLGDLAEVELVQPTIADSTSLSPAQVLGWSTTIGQALERPEVAGAVVLQGTDTLEECAYLFDLTLATEKPVVFSGAMRSPDEIGFDGIRNATGAISSAVSPHCRGLGALVVMNDQIHAAREVEKAHTTALEAFVSALGPLGFVGDGGRQVKIRRQPMGREHVPTTRLEPRVALLTCALGTNSTPVDAALRAGARGLVVAALGAGDVPREMARGLERALAAGIAVVVARRCAAGEVVPRYADVGSGRWLADRGALFASDLSAAKARIKLMLALGSGDGNEGAQHFESWPR